VAIFTKVTKNKCINDGHRRDNENIYSSVLSNDRSSEKTATFISAKTDTPRSAVFL